MMEKMTTNKSSLEEWLDTHPLLKKFYVPLVITATFVVQVGDILRGSRGR